MAITQLTTSDAALIWQSQNLGINGRGHRIEVLVWFAIWWGKVILFSRWRMRICMRRQAFSFLMWIMLLPLSLEPSKVGQSVLEPIQNLNLLWTVVTWLSVVTFSCPLASGPTNYGKKNPSRLSSPLRSSPCQFLLYLFFRRNFCIYIYIYVFLYMNIIYIFWTENLGS